MIKYWTRDREAGNRIEWFSSYEEAEQAIKRYEDEDKKDETYEDNFYEIYEDDSIIKASEYNFKELVEQASNRNSTTEERMELWYWFERYGSVYSWNGECYKIDKQSDLYPIYEETVDEDGEIEYGDVIDCEIR